MSHLQEIIDCLEFFKFDHLPDRLQVVSRPFLELALETANRNPGHTETAVALRKLLEAKDAAVRSAIAGMKNGTDENVR